MKRPPAWLICRHVVLLLSCVKFVDKLLPLKIEAMYNSTTVQQYNSTQFVNISCGFILERLANIVIIVCTRDMQTHNFD
jgi:hypothetical protein